MATTSNRGRRGLAAAEQLALAGFIEAPTVAAMVAWLQAQASGYPTPGADIAGNAYVLASADSGKLRKTTSSALVTITIPLNLNIFGVTIRQGTDAGIITFAAAAGVNLEAQFGSTLTTIGRNSVVNLLRAGPNDWFAIGGLDSL